MNITFNGAARTVTGSQFLLSVNGHKLLLECGFFQGKRRESYERNLNFPYNPADIDAVILSHAHIDHSGNLPNLVKSGYWGPINTTSATAHLANLMLIDSGRIQEFDASFINKKRARRGNQPVEPIYTTEDAAAVAQLFSCHNYGAPFEVVPGVTATLVDAGHILGSAGVVLDIEEHRRKFRLWFSGDIGRPELLIVGDPVLPEKVDYLIMECTYGDKPHGDHEAAFEELRQIVKGTVQRGGKVIIPAFAVGRTQELVYALHRMIDSHDIPQIPVYVDSPLAINATEIFRAHPECFDEETREFIRTDKHRAALGFDHLTYTRSVEESKAINDLKEPVVIISASGMAEAGRILHHLRNNIEDPRNTILIVSWQAPHTLGRRLAERDQVVKIFGETYERRAEVATIGGLSAHAGQKLLTEYAQSSEHTLKKTFLVHGEQASAEALQARLGAVGITETYFPDLNEVAEL